MENHEISEGLGQPDLADSCEIEANDARTVDQNDTRLTQPRSPPVRGHVYFIRAGEFIKIGYSTRPLERLRNLQTSNAGTLEIVGTRRASREFETELHQHFKQFRVRGEWFKVTRSILRYIEQNTPEGIARAKARREFELNSIKPAKTKPLSAEAKAMIKSLHAVRTAHGAQSVMGRACSNLAEIIPALANYERPPWAEDERQTLPWLAMQQVRRIEELKAATN